jgi:uncharacterized protein YyaL (SSP411 family)
MEKESFMSPEIADLLNSSFIPVKIDREERPDIDSIYMNYVQASTGHGGWPLNVFITPDLQPVFGGTYFPGPGSAVAASSEGVDFAGILEKMADVWRTQEKRCRDSAEEVTKQLRDFAQEGVHSQAQQKPDALDLELLEEAYRTMAHSYDSTHGGLSTAPKFPVPVKLRFLLQLPQWPQPLKDILGANVSLKSVSMAFNTLRKMARGGIRDHIGYGFARYSVTEDWSLPHFEKMLYDQALLLDAYLDAFLATNESEMLGAVYSIATYLTNVPLGREGGGFYASEDADSYASKSDDEKREGAFYVWTRKELDSLLTPQQADIAARFYNIRSHGNVPRDHDPHDDFLDQNVLAIVSTPALLSKELGFPEIEIVSILKEAREKMRAHRSTTRPAPALDDKIITAWNGLAIASLARASAAIAIIDPAASKTWIDAAIAAASFLRSTMYDAEPRILWRVYRNGRGSIRGLADDYAAVITGCLELYAATLDIAWLRWADELQASQIRDFWAEEGAFYTAPQSVEGTQQGDLLLRLKAGMDNAEPSANSLSAMNLCRLASLLEDESYEDYARQTIAAFEAEIEQYPSSFPGMLGAVAWLGVGAKNVWVLGADKTGAGKLEQEVQREVELEKEGKDGGLGKKVEEEVRQENSSGLELDKVLFKLRGSMGVGTTFVRLTGKEDEGEKWLKGRNKLLGEMKVREGDFKVMVCEKGSCREVASYKEI